MTNAYNSQNVLQDIRKHFPSCIITICYHDALVFSSKESAISYYEEGACCSEGSERDRYLTIIEKLEHCCFKDANDDMDNYEELNQISGIRIDDIKLTFDKAKTQKIE